MRYLYRIPSILPNLVKLAIDQDERGGRFLRKGDFKKNRWSNRAKLFFADEGEKGLKRNNGRLTGTNEKKRNLWRRWCTGTSRNKLETGDNGIFTDEVSPTHRFLAFCSELGSYLFICQVASFHA